MELISYAFVFIAALVAGAINSVAGGGTFITFPLLVFLGQSSIQANITSTIALWPGTIASSVAYRKLWWEERAHLPKLIAVGLVGSAVGAYALLATPELKFRAIVPYLMFSAAAIFTFGPLVLKRFNFHEIVSPKPTIGVCIFQLIIGFYGGYFGAGIGILMLAMLQLMGMANIHRMNALKALIASGINAVAFFIFLFFGNIEWEVTLVMLCGGILGGYFGAKTALKVSPKTIRNIVIVISWLMSGYFIALD